jgi:thiosulfate reductase cytochrome b subunit
MGAPKYVVCITRGVFMRWTETSDSLHASVWFKRRLNFPALFVAALFCVYGAREVVFHQSFGMFLLVACGAVYLVFQRTEDERSDIFADLTLFSVVRPRVSTEGKSYRERIDIPPAHIRGIRAWKDTLAIDGAGTQIIIDCSRESIEDLKRLRDQLEEVRLRALEGE